ncbi:MAG: glycosyltransferase family 4 protein [Myxococcales bacterium]|nr:glycosyltransferase family 4 protein [Myxococcales bacterium]
MHIVILTENFPPERNASASRIHERARWWVRWGHQVTVVTSFPNFPEGRLFEGYRNDWYGEETIDGIHVIRVKTFIAANTGFGKRIADFLSFMATGSVAGVFRTEPDVVLGNSPQFFAGVAGGIVALLRRRPFVFEIADLWPHSVVGVGAMKPGLAITLAEKLELELYRRAQAVVALTPAFKLDLMRRGVPGDKVHVIVNGVELERYKPIPRDESLGASLGLRGKFVVGYIGTLGMAHALENVLHAAQRLRDVPEVQFLFVGPGAAREALIAERDRLSLANVHFVPSQPKEIIDRYWSLCDVALVHLKNDPVFSTVIPSKIFEAMAMGIPVLLAAPRGEASSIIDETGAGIVVDAERPEVLADAVRSLRADPARLRELAAVSLSAAPSYTRERQARLVLDVLQRAADR